MASFVCALLYFNKYVNRAKLFGTKVFTGHSIFTDILHLGLLFLLFIRIPTVVRAKMFLSWYINGLGERGYINIVTAIVINL